MISTVLGQLTGQLEKRFILNALFPMLVFALAVGAAIAAGTGGPVAALEGWEAGSAAEKALTAIAAVSVVFLFANLLNHWMQWIISLFEGYARPASFLASPARRRQLKRADELLAKAKGDSEAADEFQRTFPVHPRTLTANDVAPTRLGNLLRSAETYPMDRYGVDSVRVWPRLSPLLTEPILSAMTAARTSMEFLLAVSFLSGLYAPAASIYLIWQGVDLFWVLAALLGGSLISICTYMAALAPAAIYGEQIRAAFDLHRLQLLKQVGMPLPATLDEERRTWDELHKFLDRGDPAPYWRFVIPSK